ncbi:hypothetical protein ACJX0J_008472, partial [Zea mays]
MCMPCEGKDEGNKNFLDHSESLTDDLRTFKNTHFIPHKGVKHLLLLEIGVIIDLNLYIKILVVYGNIIFVDDNEDVCLCAQFQNSPRGLHLQYVHGTKDLLDRIFNVVLELMLCVLENYYLTKHIAIMFHFRIDNGESLNIINILFILDWIENFQAQKGEFGLELFLAKLIFKNKFQCSIYV